MVKYSLDLRQEYKVIDKLHKIKNFFERDRLYKAYKTDSTIKILTGIEKMILDKIVETMKIYAIAMIQNHNVEFIL